MNQSELEAIICNRAKRGKTCASKSWLVWVLPLIGRESGERFFNQSQCEVKQNQSKTRITFETQLKTALQGKKAGLFVDNLCSYNQMRKLAIQ